MKKAWNWVVAVVLGALTVSAWIQAGRYRKRAKKAEKRNEDIASGQVKGHLDDATAARHEANAASEMAKASEAKARARIEEIKRLEHEPIADSISRWNDGLSSPDT